MIWLGGALAAGLAAWWLDHRRRRYADQATTPAAALFAGFNLVKGRAWGAEPLSSRRTHTPAVWWEYLLEEQRRHQRRNSNQTEHRWHQVQHLVEAVPEFEVVDDTGTALVRPAGAVVVPRTTHTGEVSGHPGRMLNPMFREVEPGVLLGRTDATGLYRETERVVGHGDEIFVTGRVQLDDERVVPVIARNVMISTRTEEFHVRLLTAALVVALLVMVGTLTFGMATLIHPDDPTDPLAWFPGLGVSAIVLVLAWLVITYNRLRLIAQAADRSWSLVDVQLRRRHDLIPNLQRVVAAHAGYERETLEGTVEARTKMDDATQETEVEALSAEAELQTTALRQLLAVAEAVPELTVDESFRRLQQELADAEDRIAASRTFHNDSVTMLRDRSQQFPELLIAWLIELEHRDLIGARGFERTVPAITHEFDTQTPVEDDDRDKMTP